MAWQLRTTYTRKKARATSAARYSFMSFMNETEEKQQAFVSSKDVDYPRKIELLGSAPSDPFASWKPQIKSVTLPSGVTVPPIAVTAPERSPVAHDELPPTPQSGPSVSPLPTPPPVYRILGLHPIPVPATPPESEAVSLPPPTPMHRNPGRTVSTLMHESFDLPPSPVLSPRSASFHPIADSMRPVGLATGIAPRLLPRTMVVATSFQPTRPDELGLRTGETLRLIREFDDEWCLVQRVGRSNAERGVVPRFCLSEHPRVVKSYGRISSSIFNGVPRK